MKIKQYILYNPLDTLQDIILGCDLDCAKSTLCQYLKKYGIESKVPRSKIVISDINKKKRVEFAKLMLGKTDLELESIWLDNARIHKTAAVLSYMEENHINTFEWPPQSPDLSPIENILNAMKMKLKAMKPRPKTYPKMRDAMLEIWAALTDKLREDLVGTFKDRLKKVLLSKGDLIKF